jgi:photosystem II stability/assembly factor-like uncharacterized protein
MEIVVGTSSGVFLGDSGNPSRGLAGPGVRHLTRACDCLFAAGTDGVYRSSDDGRSWERSGVDAGEVWYVAAPEDSGRTVYAGTQPAHLFVSRDAGDSWQEVASFLEAPDVERWCVPNSTQGARALALAFDPFEASHLWVGVEVGGVVASNDDGRHWSLTQPGGNADVHLLMAHPKKRGVLFATTGYGRNDDRPMEPRLAGPYRSSDGGVTWEYLGSGMQPHYTRPMCMDPRPPHVLTAPAALNARSSIKDPDGAQSRLYQSEDDGATWRSLGDAAHSPSRARLTAVASDPSRAGGVLVGTETGEVWRVGPDCSWTQLVGDLPPVQALLTLS